LDRRHLIDALSNFGLLPKNVAQLFARNVERTGAAIGLTMARCRVTVGPVMPPC